MCRAANYEPGNCGRDGSGAPSKKIGEPNGGHVRYSGPRRGATAMSPSRRGPLSDDLTRYFVERRPLLVPLLVSDESRGSLISVAEKSLAVASQAERWGWCPDRMRRVGRCEVPGSWSGRQSDASSLQDGLLLVGVGSLSSSFGVRCRLVAAREAGSTTGELAFLSGYRLLLQVRSKTVARPRVTVVR